MRMSLHVVSSRLQNALSTVEAFCILPRCLGFNSTDSQQRPESIRREPVFISLSFEALHDHTDLFLTDRLVQVNKQIRRSNIAVVLHDLVFEYQVIPVGVPCQL